jgi:hypothetical protein
MTLAVDLDVLRSLLARGAESDDLDYKSAFDLSAKSSVMEIVKDVAAMESLVSGGYIVIGADDAGGPSGTFDARDASSFDEQRVRSKIVSYLGEPLDFSSALHSVDGQPYLLIGVGPNRDGMRIMSKIGQYDDKTVWQESDVFVRRGTSSIRWNQHEARGIIERIVAARKEDWRSDVLETIKAATPAFDPGGFVNVMVEMPEGAFASAVIELIRRGDTVGLDLLRRKVLSDSLGVIGAAVVPGADASAGAVELSDQLYRLDILLTLAARYDQRTLYGACSSDLRVIYDAVDESFHYEVPRRFAQGHQQVLVHMYAIGSVLVTDRKWSYLHDLFHLAPISDGNGFWKTIGRKAEVMVARSGLLQDENGTRIGLIEKAKPVTSRLLDLVATVVPDQTSLLVQVDVYRGIALSTGTGERLGAYTNFAFYNSPRAEPAFLTVLDDAEAREALFSGSEEDLKSAYRMLSSTALREAFAYNGWDGFENRRLHEFVGDPEE